MSYLSPEVQHLVDEQNINRKNWNSREQYLRDYLLEENKEREEAVTLAILGDDPMSYAGEVGDVVYIANEILRITDHPTQIPLEIMRAYYETVEQALEIGISINDAVLMKIRRNDLKYPHTLTHSEQDIADARRVSKEQWKLMNGEKMFAIAYMFLGEDYGES